MRADDPIDSGLLICHVATANTRWFRVHAAMLDWGVYDDDSLNGRWWTPRGFVAEVGCRMSDAQSRWTTRAYRRNPAKAVAKANARIKEATP